MQRQSRGCRRLAQTLVIGCLRSPEGTFSVPPPHRDYTHLFAPYTYVALTGTETGSVFGKESQAPDPLIVASQVKKLGVGKAVKVKLTGGEKPAGRIESIGADTFTVKTSKRGGERAIPYAQVAEVKDPGAANLDVDWLGRGYPDHHCCSSRRPLTRQIYMANETTRDGQAGFPFEP